MERARGPLRAGSSGDPIPEDAPAPPPPPGGGDHDSDGDDEPDDHDPPPPRRGRGPDRGQRTRRTWRSTAAGETTVDWSRFNMDTTLKALRIAHEADARRLLRKLHLRWWHASAASMQKTLRAAGVAEAHLRLIRSIVDTCRICREWQKPKPNAVSSLSVPQLFNDQVETDLLFYEREIILHAIDRTTRWHAAVSVPNKEGSSLRAGLEDCWIRTHGPMRELIVDGELGLAEEESLKYFNLRGIQRTVRAPDQHARFAERHGAMLRFTMNVMI